MRARLPRPEIARFAEFLVAGEPGRRGGGAVIEVAIRRAARGRGAADAGVRGRRGARPRGVRATSTLEPGERAVVPTGLAVEIPDGYAGFVQPRSGLAARHGIGIVNSPGLIDSGYRGEIRVVLVNHDPAEPFSGRARHADRAARHRARRVGDGRRGRGARGQRARRPRVRVVGRMSVGEPRVRVSAILRWRGRILLIRHEKAGEEIWLLPGGGVRPARACCARSSASCARRRVCHGIGEEVAARRPGRARRQHRAGANPLSGSTSST